MRDGAHKLSKNVEELREGILKARMLPFSNLTENLPRAVRDIAKQSQKEVTLELGGGEISLDRSVLEKMGDPLIHLIRNAVDHGFEAPEFREAGGKPKAGTIKVRAHAFMDNAVIEISDDGKGIDVARLRVKAMESGIEPDIVKNMTDEEALLLICTPGLSLKDIVTDVSGRGVGMDIVKESIEAIGGT
ncbi:MAG: chemotaxis protein CheA, partial [Deltaproteobacteria bacterium]|nr:chemotaxis protein CheA [Deltaproteobacteria bacterium]